jgi:prefoldin subunit 5
MQAKEFAEAYETLKIKNQELKEKNQRLTANLAELTMVALRLRKQLDDERKMVKRR